MTNVLRLDSVSLSSNHSNELSNEFAETASITSSVSSAADWTENWNNCLVTTEINDSGVCCEKGEKYAIYVISVTCIPLQTHGQNPDELKREWITYRRFSEFNDLHMTIRKRYVDLRDLLNLPTKSLINNTSAEVRLKRQKELNDYLMVNRLRFSSGKKFLFYLLGQTLLKPKILQTHPQLAELLSKFLKNQQWKHEQTELARKVGHSFLLSDGWNGLSFPNPRIARHRR